MRSSNSRKGQTSITHLLNFSSPPRHFNHARYVNNNRRGRYSSLHAAADKARYVFGNYRFIVDPRHDYTAQSIDSDIHLDWDHILQVVASTESQGTSCPICLDTPTAPRMSKCGHIFCLPCLIRYMHSEEEQSRHNDKRSKSRSCPLCYDVINLSDIRPVRWYTGQENPAPREGQDVVLRLMRRAAGNTLALPRDGAEGHAMKHEIPWYFAAEVLDYARIMKGTGSYIIEQYDAELSALQEQAQTDELMFGDDNVEWNRKALKAVNSSKARIEEDDLPEATKKEISQALPKAKAISKNYEPIQFHNGNDVPDMYRIQHAAKSGHHIDDEPQHDSSKNIALPEKSQNIEIHQASGSTIPNRPRPAQQPTAEYFFYQALQHYYLSSLDIRILKEAFGSFSSFPSTILPKVERVSTGHVVDDDLRKRNKWLSHLPRGCEVNFLECDWTDTVPADVLERFREEVDRRRKLNEDKEAREERDRLRAEREEEKQYAYLRRRRVEESPPRTFRKDDFVPLLGDAEPGDITSSTPPWSNRPAGSPFASLADMSTSPSTSRTVWGTPAITSSSSPTLRAVPDSKVDDGWFQGWEEALMEEEVAAQAEAIAISNGDVAKPATASKKKKGKKITLMSTNVRRGA